MSQSNEHAPLGHISSDRARELDHQMWERIWKKLNPYHPGSYQSMLSDVRRIAEQRQQQRADVLARLATHPPEEVGEATRQAMKDLLRDPEVIWNAAQGARATAANVRQYSDPSREGMLAETTRCERLKKEIAEGILQREPGRIEQYLPVQAVQI
jgi:hypothetical protein